MAFIPVPETVMAEVRMALFGQNIENTLYFQKGGGWDTASATSLANGLIVWWTTLPSVPLSDQLSLREVTVSDLSSASGFQVTVAAPTPAPTGGDSTASYPSNVALCVSFRTGHRGRSFRGRNYLAGLPKSTADSDQITSTLQDYFKSAYEGIPASITLSGGTWVVVSRFADHAPRTTGVSTPVTAVVVVDPFVDSQRRRLIGRGT